jgi:hypothetical protein
MDPRSGFLTRPVQRVGPPGAPMDEWDTFSPKLRMRPSSAWHGRHRAERSLVARPSPPGSASRRAAGVEDGAGPPPGGAAAEEDVMDEGGPALTAPVDRGLALRIQRARCARGHTQKGLAAALCVHVSVLAGIERGRSAPSAALLSRMRRLLGGGDDMFF